VKSKVEIDCPFCGNRGPRSKEHVWAQWMRSAPGAKELLHDAKGNQISLEHGGLVKDAFGRYEAIDRDPSKVAELLPHVTVWVCDSCNSGWMSQLEDNAKKLFAPYFVAGWPIGLTPERLALLATWATKSWMAYALLSDPEANPFTTEEYRSMAASPAPLARSRLWLLHSHAPTAYVGIGVAGTLITFGEATPDLATTQNNAGFGYLATGGMVLFIALAPHDHLEAHELLEPFAAQADGVQRIWPAPTEQLFPEPAVPDEVMSDFLGWPDQMEEMLDLPVVGLTDEEVLQVRREFQAGAEPSELRERWSQDQ